MKEKYYSSGVIAEPLTKLINASVIQSSIFDLVKKWHLSLLLSKKTID